MEVKRGQPRINLETKVSPVVTMIPVVVLVPIPSKNSGVLIILDRVSKYLEKYHAMATGIRFKMKIFILKKKFDRIRITLKHHEYSKA